MFIKRAILHPSSLLAPVLQKSLERKSGIFAVTWSDSPRNHVRNIKKKVWHSFLPVIPWGFQGASSGSGEELPGSGWALPFWLRRRTVMSTPGQDLPLLAPNKSCPFLAPDKFCIICFQARAAPLGSGQDLHLLLPDKSCPSWLRTRSASSGSEQELPYLAPDKICLCLLPDKSCPSWLRTRSASSASRQELPLLAPDNICLFWLRTRAALLDSGQDLLLLVPDKTYLFWLKRRASFSLTPSYPLPDFDIASVSKIDGRLSPPVQQYVRSGFAVCSPGWHPVRCLTDSI